MEHPKFCRRCKRADCGNGEWVKPYLWGHDSFLRQTNKNIKKYGEIEKLDACDICVREIKRNGHKVRERKSEK